MKTPAAWIVLAMIVACGAWGQSQPPAPTPTKQSRPVQKTAQNKGSAANKDQRGTEDRPLFVRVSGVPVVEVHGAPQAQQKPAETANQKDDGTPHQWWLKPDALAAWFTGALVFIGFVTGGVLIFQSVLLRRQVRLAREEFDASHRPWLAITNLQITRMDISEWTQSRPDGYALWINGRYKITNSGSSPALHTVHWEVAENRPSTVAEADKVMISLRTNSASQRGMAIPPNDGIDVEFTSRIEITRPPINTRSSITLCMNVGIAYQGTPSNEAYETIESFGIFQRQGQGIATPAALDFEMISSGSLPEMMYLRAFNISRMT